MKHFHAVYIFVFRIQKSWSFSIFSTWRSYPDAQQINCKTICVCKSFYCFNDTQHQALTSFSIASFCLPIQKYTFYGYFFHALSLSRSISEWIVIFNEIQFSISKWDFSFSPLLDIVIIFVAVLLLCNFRANKSAHIFELNCIEKEKREEKNAYLYWWKGMTQYVLLAHKNLLGIRVNRCCISNGT